MKCTLITTLLGLLLVASACTKKDDAAKADNASTKPAEKPADKPAPSGEMTAADYEAKDLAMMDKATAAFSSGGGDCDKTAAAASKLFDDSKAQMTALEAFEKAHPDVKKQVEDKYKDKTKAFEDTVGKVLESCKDNKAMQDAIKKMPD